MKKLFKVLFIFALILSCSKIALASDFKSRSKDDLKRDFDVVAQNYGALQYAFYTFTLEFERAPENIDEIVSTGHLMVKLVDPYTGKEPILGSMKDKPRQGGLYYSKKDKEWADLACYFVNPNNPAKMRSLHTQVRIFTNKELKKMVFGDDASRNEKLTRVYLVQLGDAIDSFEQRNGRLPESLDEMMKIGDVNVTYLNPFTKKLVKASEEFSAGDFFYRKFKKSPAEKEEYYEVVGWGEKEPVYYFSSDESRESYDWDKDNDKDATNIKKAKDKSERE